MTTRPPKKCKDWAEFELRLNSYFKKSGIRRGQWAFRGQANADWPLKASIDRVHLFKNASDRQAQLAHYLREFQRQATGLPFSHGFPETDREWELLARHHGLPSAVLDWTSSPYIAAYFAFADPSIKDSKPVSIWAFDRTYFESQSHAKATPKDDPIEIWDEYIDLQVNPRAVEQQALFMRVNQPSPALEEVLQSHLLTFVLPSSVRSDSLGRLAAMGITARRLFRDLDHAAETARWKAEDSQP